MSPDWRKRLTEPYVREPWDIRTKLIHHYAGAILEVCENPGPNAIEAIANLARSILAKTAAPSAASPEATPAPGLPPAPGRSPL